ncbi:hypothetical protein C0Q70_07940 [Pomacea canaliculata]|uniref:Adenosine deaminase n=1 Tax=Pomacea canaliculata TaxID=400727 RepID=A0A2T7PGG2_POMCA|nr:hypothetical protein C0Q70_07940 [Pomacea canaliculata]
MSHDKIVYGLKKTVCADVVWYYKYITVGNVLQWLCNGVYRVAYELCEDAAKAGIHYMEVRYSPHFLSNSLGVKTYAPTCDGVFSPHEVVKTVNKAFACGSEDFGITNGPGMSWSYATSSPVKAWLPWTLQVQKLEAQKRGLACIAHAGEAGPADMVKMSVEKLGAVRIGHGYRCLEDELLYQDLLKKRVHFEVCPLSSLMTNGAPNGKNHPILRFAKDGANFSINSDDPTLFDNSLADDYKCALELGLTKEQIITSIFNAARASLGTPAEKEKLLAKLISVYGKY